LTRRNCAASVLPCFGREKKDLDEKKRRREKGNRRYEEWVLSKTRREKTKTGDSKPSSQETRTRKKMPHTRLRSTRIRGKGRQSRSEAAGHGIIQRREKKIIRENREGAKIETCRFNGTGKGLFHSWDSRNEPPAKALEGKHTFIKKKRTLRDRRTKMELNAPRLTANAGALSVIPANRR